MPKDQKNLLIIMGVAGVLIFVYLLFFLKPFSLLDSCVEKYYSRDESVDQVALLLEQGESKSNDICKLDHGGFSELKSCVYGERDQHPFVFGVYSQLPRFTETKRLMALHDARCQDSSADEM